MADWLTVDDYKAWARIATTDTRDDAAIGDAVVAVSAAVAKRCPRLFVDVDGEPPAIPGDVMQAALLWTNRLMSRRNSPDGVVGVADLGTAQIRPTDADILRLLSPYTAMVLS